MSTRQEQKTSIPESERKHFQGEVHNYRNDYKFTFELHQRANGEFQMGGKIRSDNEDGLSNLFINLMTDLRDLANNKGFPIVKKVGAD